MKRRKIYYSNCNGYSDVLSTNPTPKTLRNTLKIWKSRLDKDSFMGIEVSKHKTLQFREEKGRIYTEFLDTHKLYIQFTYLNNHDLEDLLRTIFKRSNLLDYLNEKNYPWKIENLWE